MTLRNPDEMYSILGYKVITEDNTVVEIPRKKSNTVTKLETQETFAKKQAISRVVVFLALVVAVPAMKILVEFGKSGILVNGLNSGADKLLQILFTRF